MNCQITKTVDNKEIQKDIKQIDDNILIMDIQIKEITMKLNEIQNFTTVFQKKSNLYNNENNIELKMQVSLLLNEKEHITNMKKIFITNLFNELYELSNNIILLISSFLNLEFNENINSSEILKKLVRIKQLTTIRMSDIYESISAITKNLNLVYDTLHEFNEYIENMGHSIKTNNYHCLNVYTSLKHKHNFIMLEYDKYYNTLNNIIPFYISLSEKINGQLISKYVLFHCLNNVNDNNDFLHGSNNLKKQDSSSATNSQLNRTLKIKKNKKFDNIYDVNNIELDNSKLGDIGLDNIIKKNINHNKKKRNGIKISAILDENLNISDNGKDTSSISSTDIKIDNTINNKDDKKKQNNKKINSFKSVVDRVIKQKLK